ncbi:MAG: hypothetical protein H0U75_11795 [Legionella sp.]|nr:hypothetical protein [Legionella sp.]
MLTLKQRVINIDNYANKILSQGGDEALLRSMHDIMGDLKLILDTANHDELDVLCGEYPGFYRCMKWLENLASGIANGTLPKLTSEKLEKHLTRVRQNNYELKQEWIEKYEQIRKMLKNLHPNFMIGLTRDGVDRCAKRLDISKNGALLLNTEHEMNVFFDYCLYQCYSENSSAIYKSFKQYTGGDTKSVSLFEKVVNGYFAYLQIIEPIGDAGLVVFDLERQTEHLMIDKGLHLVAKNTQHHMIITHVIDCDDFIITTGASTPVDFTTIDGAKVHSLFESFYKKLTSGTLDAKERRQYVTDVYKLCLHEDIIAIVSSPKLPFGDEALKARTHASDSRH